MLSKFAQPPLRPPSKEESQQPYGSLLSLEITSDMLEEVREYDPHKWNDFPEVEPPEDVWMRVERCVDGRTYHFAARYVPVGDSEDYEWLSEANLSIDVDRFRPWDEEDEE